MPTEVIGMLAESRRREKAQALFYRYLAAEAEASGDAGATERLNELHADEQHHLSRLTARILELGASPENLRDVAAPKVEGSAWEDVARAREHAEVDWYERLLSKPLDDVTRALLEEIVESERHHEAELGGKWMSA